MRRMIILLLIATGLLACKKPYDPGVVNSPNSYLVVEGVINTNDTTKIKLSRTVNLSASTTVNPVSGATLTVEDDINNTYVLIEQPGGLYMLLNQSMGDTHQYRLRIKTPDNKEYLSDFEVAKAAPAIDSVSFKAVGNTLQLFANSHDPTKNTRYYRFDYNETWQFHSKYFSSFVSDGSQILQRTNQQYVNDCFANATSSTILLASSAKLTSDVIFEAPITQIASTAERIEDRYSIMVHEYALSANAFKFWTLLKKNTEQLGSIFDAQPSQNPGNIHNTADPLEPVIGYISAGAVASKRIFIGKEQLPPQWITQYPYDCPTDTLYYSSLKTGHDDVTSTLVPLSNGLIPINGIYKTSSPKPIGFSAANQYCIDCTLRGYKTAPDFW